MAAAAIARIAAGSDAAQRRLSRHDRAIAGIIAEMERQAQRGDVEHLAAAADRLAMRLNQETVELIALAAHCYEARQQGEVVAQTASFTEAMRRAAIDAATAPLLAEIAELRQSRPPRARHAARGKHLKLAGGIAAGTVAASLAVPAVIASQDSAAVHHWSPPPAAVRLHADRPDSAVLMPSYTPRAPYVARHAKPSADAASASPAPSPSPSSAPAPQPSAPSPAASPVDYDGYLDVQTAEVVVGLSGSPSITFTAVGGSASWTATPPAGITLSESRGVLEDGQSETVTVKASPGLPAGAGVITVTDGAGHPETVPVTWVAVPGLPV